MNDTIPYNGPSDLKSDWETFAADYLKQNPLGRHELEYLNELVFKGGIKELLERHGIQAEAMRGQNTDVALQKLQILRECIEAVGMFSAEQTLQKKHRALNRVMTQSIADQWVEIERKHDMFPPPKLLNATKKRRQEIRTMQRAVLGFNEAALAESALCSLNYGIMKAARVTTAQKIGDEAAHDMVRDRFHSSLFNYDPAEGTTFATYLYTCYKSFLKERPCKTAGFRDGDSSLDMPLGKKETPFSSLLADKTARSPAIQADQKEAMDNIKSRIGGLSGREQEAFAMMYGPGSISNMSTIGRTMDVKPQRVDHLLRKARKRLEGTAPAAPERSWAEKTQASQTGKANQER